MKKSILVSCIAIATVTFAGCDKKIEKKETAKQSVVDKKETVVTDGPSFDVITSQDGSIDSVYYDAEGKITRISQTGKDVYGETKQPIVDVFAYTADGKLGHITRTVDNTNGAPTISQYLFSYTKEGRLYTCTHRTPGKPERGRKKTPMVESKDVIGYTKKGALLKITNDKLIRTFDYDKEGHLTRQVIKDYDVAGAVTRDDVWTYSYDDNFNCTEAVAHLTVNVGLLNEDTLSNIYRFEYDAKGRCISENDCGDVANSYEYNSKGCQVSMETTVSGQVLLTSISPGSTQPRWFLYRQRGVDLFNEPYYINLDVVNIPLSWFNREFK